LSNIIQSNSIFYNVKIVQQCNQYFVWTSLLIFIIVINDTSTLVWIRWTFTCIETKLQNYNMNVSLGMRLTVSSMLFGLPSLQNRHVTMKPRHSYSKRELKMHLLERSIWEHFQHRLLCQNRQRQWPTSRVVVSKYQQSLKPSKTEKLRTQWKIYWNEKWSIQSFSTSVSDLLNIATGEKSKSLDLLNTKEKGLTALAWAEQNQTPQIALVHRQTFEEKSQKKAKCQQTRICQVEINVLRSLSFVRDMDKDAFSYEWTEYTALPFEPEQAVLQGRRPWCYERPVEWFMGWKRQSACNWWRSSVDCRCYSIHPP